MDCVRQSVAASSLRHCECAGVRESGSPGVRESGSPGVRESGAQALAASVRNVGLWNSSVARSIAGIRAGGGSED
jgi:hypothetical protein